MKVPVILIASALIFMSSAAYVLTRENIDTLIKQYSFDFENFVKGKQYYRLFTHPFIPSSSSSFGGYFFLFLLRGLYIEENLNSGWLAILICTSFFMAKIFEGLLLQISTTKSSKSSFCGLLSISEALLGAIIGYAALRWNRLSTLNKFTLISIFVSGVAASMFIYWMDPWFEMQFGAILYGFLIIYGFYGNKFRSKSDVNRFTYSLIILLILYFILPILSLKL